MAKAHKQWYWQPTTQTPGIITVFAGNAVPSCPLCGTQGMVLNSRKHKGKGQHTAHCPGCKCGTAPCSTPFNAMLCYVKTRS